MGWGVVYPLLQRVLSHSRRGPLPLTQYSLSIFVFLKVDKVSVNYNESISSFVRPVASIIVVIGMFNFLKLIAICRVASFVP